MDQAELVGQAAQGDIEAFTVLVDAHYGRILHYVLGQVRDRSIAEEVTQETFLKAFIGLRGLRDGHSFAPWLFAISRNELRDYFTGRHREKSTAALAEKRAWSAGARGERDRVDALYSAITRLSEEHHEIVILKYFAGLSMQEIAALLGIEVKMVKSRLYEARKRLRSLLAADLPLPDRVEILKAKRRLLMDKVKMVEVGTYVFTRLALRTQLDILARAVENEPFPEPLLKEIGAVERGKELVALCEGRLSFNEFGKILAYSDQHTIKRLLMAVDGGQADRITDFLTGFGGAGYLVEAFETVLTVPSIEETIGWYEQVLGWHGDICARDEEGRPFFGCVFMDDIQPLLSKTRSLHGFNLSRGDRRAEAPQGLSALVYVIRLEKLHQRVTQAGWDRLTPIETRPWGVRSFFLDDLNGYTIQFAEWEDGQRS